MHGEKKTESPINTGIERTDCSDENLEVYTDQSFVSLVPFTENNEDVQASKNSEPSESMLENSKLFFQKLSEFHQSSGLSLAVSVVGTVVDLHMLYKEVSMRGGFIQVTKDERWSEVASVLNFASRSPKPYFQLRDLYRNLIYQFELIYFFRSCGKPATLPVYTSSNGDCPTMKRTNICQLSRVMVGSEKLNGSLYHLKDSVGKQLAVVPTLMDRVGLEDSKSEPMGMRVSVESTTQQPIVRSTSKAEAKLEPSIGPSLKEVKKKDREAPLGMRSAYQIFLGKECDRLKKMHGESLGRNVRQMVIDKWKCLSESDRMPYIEDSRKDKERFNQEMNAYKKRKNMQIGKTKYTIYNSGASVHDFKNDYHVSLQIEETDKSGIPDESMVNIAVELMEKARQLDATLQIDLDNDFLSVL